MSRARVLTIERVLEDARFLDEALAEAQETHETSMLLTDLHLEDVDDAVAVLGSEPIDAVLLGLHGGREALEAFVAVRTIAPHVPVIAIVDAADRDFARALLRQGAQDYLVRGQFDYLPLARALENAIERHRVLWAAQNDALFDPMTGFLNRRGFLLLADWRCADGDTLIVYEFNFRESDPDARDLALLDFAAKVRGTMARDALVARCGPSRFVTLGHPDDAGSIQPPIGTLSRSVTTHIGPGQPIDSALAFAEERLCENDLAYVNHSP